MNEIELLLRRLNEEIEARQAAEETSKKKLAELYKANGCLQQALAAQKRISDQLKSQTRDLEKQKVMTECERLAKSTLQNIIQSSIEYSIISLDLQGYFLLWNEGAHRNYGYEAKELINKQTIEILHVQEDIQSGAVKNFLEQAYKEGKAESVFQRIRKDKSHFTASVNISLRKDELGNPIGYVLISRDITESKNIEQQLIKSNQELEQFAYIASHDLKAPLRGIERLATWIEEDSGDKLDVQSKENLRLLRQRVNRMTNLIEGILQYSRAGRIELESCTVDTKQLILEIIDSINPPKKFTIILSDNLPTLHTAKIPLSQIFSNLICNSIKHHRGKTGKITINMRDSGNFYTFSVRDNGPGISAEYFEKIFQIFQTLESRDVLESTGIGLSIVKKIVESQGGKVSVESTLGKGSVFYFSWPKTMSEKSGNSEK